MKSATKSGEKRLYLWTNGVWAHTGWESNVGLFGDKQEESWAPKRERVVLILALPTSWLCVVLATSPVNAQPVGSHAR